MSSYFPSESGWILSGVGVAEGGGGLSVTRVLVEGAVSVGGSGVETGLVLVGVGQKGKVRVAVARELKLDGIAVGALSDGPRTLVKRSHAIPRIETTPMAIGIRSVRSKEGRGCISEKVLPRFYPHSLRYRVPHPVVYLRLPGACRALSRGLLRSRFALQRPVIRSRCSALKGGGTLHPEILFLFMKNAWMTLAIKNLQNCTHKGYEASQRRRAVEYTAHML
jgi:hypothetical protein